MAEIGLFSRLRAWRAFLKRDMVAWSDLGRRDCGFNDTCLLELYLGPSRIGFQKAGVIETAISTTNITQLISDEEECGEIAD
jgi:hypothetical protein